MQHRCIVADATFETAHILIARWMICLQSVESMQQKKVSLVTFPPKSEQFFSFQTSSSSSQYTSNFSPHAAHSYKHTQMMMASKVNCSKYVPVPLRDRSQLQPQQRFHHRDLRARSHRIRRFLLEIWTIRGIITHAVDTHLSTVIRFRPVRYS